MENNDEVPYPETVPVPKGIVFKFVVEGFTEPLELSYQDFKKAILFKMNQQVQEEEARIRALKAQQNMTDCYAKSEATSLGGYGLGRM